MKEFRVAGDYTPKGLENQLNAFSLELESMNRKIIDVKYNIINTAGQKGFYLSALVIFE